MYNGSDGAGIRLRYMCILRGWIQPSGLLSSFLGGCRQVEGGQAPNPLANLVAIVEGPLVRYQPWSGDLPIGQQA